MIKTQTPTLSPSLVKHQKKKAFNKQLKIKRSSLKVRGQVEVVV